MRCGCIFRWPLSNLGVGAMNSDPLESPDTPRLKTLQERVHELMLRGGFHTLKEIQINCGGSEASVSARLRHMRTPEGGGYFIIRKSIGDGLFSYHLERPINGQLSLIKEAR